MRIVITEWALASYHDLSRHFTREEYRLILRKDILRLHDYGNDRSFHNPKFWGPAQMRPN